MPIHYLFSLSRLRQDLRNLDTLRYAKQGLFADRLGCCPTTLHNYLHTAGTTWTAELNAERNRRLYKYLLFAQKPNSRELAEQLGFNSVSSFYQWHRRTQPKSWYRHVRQA